MIDTRIDKQNKTDDKVVKAIFPRKKDTLSLEPEVPTELTGAGGLVRSKHYLYDAGYKADGKPDPGKMKAECETVLAFIRVPKENEQAVKDIINGKSDAEVELATSVKAKKFKHHDKKDKSVKEAIAKADSEGNPETSEPT